MRVKDFIELTDISVSNIYIEYFTATSFITTKHKYLNTDIKEIIEKFGNSKILGIRIENERIRILI